MLALLRVPERPSDGESLTGLLNGTPPHVELDAYSESQYPLRFGWSPLRALRAGRYKLIEAPRAELYDLDRDPFEERNLYEERSDLARALAHRLTTFEGGLESRRRDNISDPTPSTELQQRLASLGYIGSGASRAPMDHHDLPDPKDCIDLFSNKSRAPSCANTGRGSWPVPIGQLFVKQPDSVSKQNP
ncbi:MAG: hypothetical protein H0W08_03140 [Acidobacteria bacterium]|nr:hypothetical protein [Acidobacteriota bacterium]